MAAQVRHFGIFMLASSTKAYFPCTLRRNILEKYQLNYAEYEYHGD